MLDAEASLRMRSRARQEAVTPDRYVRVEPNPDNSLDSMRVGSSARVPLDTAGGPEGRTQGVVRLDRVAYPRSWRVTLGEPRIEGEQETPVVGGSVPNVAWNVNPALALVSWGVQGAEFRAEIDWGRGCGFVVSADYVNVQVQALNLVGTPVTPNPAVAIFPASIAPAEAGSAPTSPPTRTIFSGNINAGALAFIKIPPFAKRVKHQRVVALTPPEASEIQFFADAAMTQTVGFDQLTNGGIGNGQQIYGMPYAIPPQAIIMRYRNIGAANSSWMSIFELEIG